MSEDRDLAAEFKEKAGRHPNSVAHQFKLGNPSQLGKGKLQGEQISPQGEKIRQGRKATKAIKEFMVELLNDSHYRNGLVKRIKAGELPSIELFLLTKALGKPKEELEITANVPLFALPTSFVMKEDVVEAESVKVLTEGDADGGNSVRE